GAVVIDDQPAHQGDEGRLRRERRDRRGDRHLDGELERAEHLPLRAVEQQRPRDVHGAEADERLHELHGDRDGLHRRDEDDQRHGLEHDVEPLDPDAGDLVSRLGNITRRLHRNEKGFTLIELVVVMPMLTVLLGGIVFTMTSLMRWNDQNREQTTQQATVRATLTQMVKELRSAMPAASGQAPIVANATATSISFFVPDRTTSASGLTVPFRLNEVAYSIS